MTCESHRLANQLSVTDRSRKATMKIIQYDLSLTDALLNYTPCLQDEEYCKIFSVSLEYLTISYRDVVVEFIVAL